MDRWTAAGCIVFAILLVVPMLIYHQARLVAAEQTALVKKFYLKNRELASELAEQAELINRLSRTECDTEKESRGTQECRVVRTFRKDFKTNVCQSGAGRLSMEGSELTHLNDNYEDVVISYPYQPIIDSNKALKLVHPVKYWRVAPHPCVSMMDIGSRLTQPYGFGFEFLYAQLLGPAKPNSNNEVPLCIDIGANLGAYTAMPAALGYRVTSLEIQERRDRELQLMVLINGWSKRVNHIFGAASGDGVPLECLHLVKNSGTLNGHQCTPADPIVWSNNNIQVYSPKSHEDFIVPGITVHDIFPKTEDVCFLKVDCDGCEEIFYPPFLDLLRSGTKLGKGPKYILAEVHKDTMGAISTLMDEFQYAAYVMSPAQALDQVSQAFNTIVNISASEYRNHPDSVFVDNIHDLNQILAGTSSKMMNVKELMRVTDLLDDAGPTFTFDILLVGSWVVEGCGEGS